MLTDDPAEEFHRHNEGAPRDTSFERARRKGVQSAAGNKSKMAPQ